MRNYLKHAQLWLHRHYAQIRQWIIVTTGFILLVFSMVMVVNQNQLIVKVSVLAEQNKVLSQQNKELNTQTRQAIKENQTIAKQNRSYTRCIAEIFALYTQNNAPVQIVSLDDCTIASETTGTNDTPIRVN